jgi:predicted transcriptional regulator
MTQTVSQLRPTAAELGILRALWDLGPSTVRQVQEAVSRDEPTGYTTVLKFLQIMHQKGLVERDESSRAHVYRARVTQQDTQRLMTSQLVDRLFDGSRSKLVLAALGDSGAATPEELAAIRAVLNDLERRSS